jgi:hypothetical protein
MISWSWQRRFGVPLISRRIVVVMVRTCPAIERPTERVQPAIKRDDDPVPIIIFASFSLFSALNMTIFACLSLFAPSASFAIFLILEPSLRFRV